MGVPDVFTGISSGGLTVKDTDGVPTVANVNTINVTNGSLTDNGGGVVTISTGGGGGGSGTVTSVDVSGGTTGLTTTGGPITASGTITLTGTLVVANGGTGATSLTDNSVLTGGGVGAINAEGNLTFNDPLLTVTGDLTITGDTTIGNANTDKLGFYGATIIVQPTTAITGATVVVGIPTSPIDFADTFDGYTVAQIVAALRNFGLLA